MNKNLSTEALSFASRPLRGKKILVTRARAQSEDITTQLEALGATVVHAPTIQIVPPQSWASVDEAISRIQQYDWIVFTSANGVRYFFGRLGELRRDDAYTLTNSICAIGPATARAIISAGSMAHLTPSDSRGEGALKAIVDHVGGETNVRRLKFLIPRARVAREALPDGLRRLGAVVDTVETYQTVKPDIQPESILGLFHPPSIDVVTFTSPSTVSNLAELLGLTDLSELFASTLVACIGPVTAEAAISYGLKHLIQPDVYNATGLVNSIVKSLGHDQPDAS